MSRRFLLDLIERAVRTFAQTAVALLGTNGVGVTDIAWGTVASVAGLAAIVSALTSLGSMSLGSTPDDGSLL